MNNIIYIGNLSYNTILYVNTNNIENQICNIIKKQINIEQNINIPLILSKYSLNIYFFSNVGNDIEGNKIINYLKNNKINIDYINILNNYNTNKKYIITNERNNTKTILSDKINIKYQITKKIMFIPDIIYNDTYNFEQIKLLKDRFKNVKIVTNLKEVSTDAINTCIISDYIVIPSKYAQILTNIKLDINNKKTIIDLYLRTKKLFFGKIIIYIEEIGSVFELNNVISIVPKMGNRNLMSKSSYDIFISTLIYGISQNYPIDKTLKIATISKYLSDNDRQNLNIKEVVDIYEKNS